MIQEMRIRNYSERTISTYLSLIGLLSKYYEKPVEQLTTNQVKDYIYYRITTDNVSVSTVNQLISTWKIINVYILGKDWEMNVQNKPVTISPEQAADIEANNKKVSYPQEDADKLETIEENATVEALWVTSFILEISTYTPV
ncbi:MAG: phage integrase N-terminal SAM-like domain-containing protein [Salinivirgaceae bacterium]|nr:phage integrase N-terminal SAM-like domain-containing protein [Salinivirgaceae bacterium]